MLLPSTTWKTFIQNSLWMLSSDHCASSGNFCTTINLYILPIHCWKLLLVSQSHATKLTPYLICIDMVHDLYCTLESGLGFIPYHVLTWPMTSIVFPPNSCSFSCCLLSSLDQNISSLLIMLLTLTLDERKHRNWKAIQVFISLLGNNRFGRDVRLDGIW